MLSAHLGGDRRSPVTALRAVAVVAEPAINVAQASAIFSTDHPVRVGLPENPYPGSDGHTTWKSSASGSITLWNSTTEPGQPWVMISGSASGFEERWWMKWMSSPSISVTNWSKRLSAASRARQS